MEPKLVFDYSDLLAANAQAETFEKTMRSVAGGGSAGGGAGGGGAAATTKTFRQWDTELRHVEHTGRGLLALFGIGGGLLGVAHLVTKEIQDWYAMLGRVNKQGADVGKNIATILAGKGPGAQERLLGRRAEFTEMGVTPEEAAEAMNDSAKMARLRGRYRQMKVSPGGPAVLEAAQSAARMEWNKLKPTTLGGKAGREEGAALASEERYRAEAMREAGWETDAEEMGRGAAGWFRTVHHTARKVKGLSPQGADTVSQAIFDALMDERTGNAQGEQQRMLQKLRDQGALPVRVENHPRADSSATN